MNTLFRICLVMCLGLLVFTLAISYLEGTGAFMVEGNAGKDLGDTGDILDTATDLDEGNMDYLWGIVIGGIGIGIAAGWLTHSIVPTGLFIFAGVFWAAFINTHSILSYGNYVPPEFMGIFTGITVFVFIGACIGMITGSG